MELQNEKQLSHPIQTAPQTLKTFITPSLTPQGPQRPVQVPVINGIPASRSGNVMPKKAQRNQGQNVSRTENLANSQIHGRKVDSPKIYVKEVSDRPKTSA